MRKEKDHFWFPDGNLGNEKLEVSCLENLVMKTQVTVTPDISSSGELDTFKGAMLNSRVLPLTPS
jgi:hypothetical protein